MRFASSAEGTVRLPLSSPAWLTSASGINEGMPGAEERARGLPHHRAGGLPRRNPAGEQHMRYLVIVFCVFAAACAGAPPTAPTSSATTSYPSQIGGGTVTTEARGGSELPFKGTYEGLETVLTPPSNHHLDAIGNATHLGRFTVTADWTLGPAGGPEPARGQPPTAIYFPRV